LFVACAMVVAAAACDDGSRGPQPTSTTAVAGGTAATSGGSFLKNVPPDALGLIQCNARLRRPGRLAIGARRGKAAGRCRHDHGRDR
jgi:hypothetical protein